MLTVVEPSTGAEIHEQVFSLPGVGQPMPLLACGAGSGHTFMRMGSRCGILAHFHRRVRQTSRCGR